MGHIFVKLLALLSLSRGCRVPESSQNATRDLIRLYGTGGTLSQEEFSRLGVATRSDWEITEDDATGRNNFCVSTMFYLVGGSKNVCFWCTRTCV